MSAFAGAKLSFFAAATFIVCPVAGFRASRSGVSFTLNLPKPGIDVSLPAAAAAVMAAKTASTLCNHNNSCRCRRCLLPTRNLNTSSNSLGNGNVGVRSWVQPDTR